MSQQNVEIVRTWMKTFERDGSTATFYDLLDPQIEWVPFEDSHTPSHGIEGARRIRDQWLDSWADHRVEVEETVARGDDVVASVHIKARGRASGVEVDVRLFPHFRVREGKIVYLFEHQDRDEALEAAGLRE